MNKVYYSSELTHWGVQGQKWGIRRYQNEDGTLTEEGKKRYGRKVLGIYDKRLPENNRSKELGEINNRREDARKAVKLYGGKNAAKKEVSEKYDKRIRANSWKALGLSAPAVALTAFAMANESIGLLAAGALPLLPITIGYAAATNALRRNKKLANSYIDDLAIKKSSIKVEE